MKNITFQEEFVEGELYYLFHPAYKPEHVVGKYLGCDVYNKQDYYVFQARKGKFYQMFDWFYVEAATLEQIADYY